MNKDAWVATLKVGDKVAVRRRWDSEYDIYSVSAVTPSGRVRVPVSDSAFWEFNPNGWLRGADPWNQTCIEPVTEQVLTANRKAKLLHKVARVDWSRVKLSVLEQVAALVAEVPGE